MENMMNSKKNYGNSVVEKTLQNLKDISRGKIGRGMSFKEKKKLLELSLR